jgi:TonB family protein
MTLLIYIIKTILVSGVLYTYYALMLRNRKIHQFNRLFLLSIPVISFIIPAFHFNLPAFWFQKDSGTTIRLLGVGQGKLEEAVTIYGTQGSRHIFTWPLLFTAIFLVISIFLLTRLLLTIRYLNRLPKNKPSLPLPEATVFFVSEKGTPFSFFRNIFWGEDQEINSQPAQQILRHELYHAVNRHSADILWIEFLTVFFWFNPFLFLIHRELRAIHEYTADEYASAETDRFSYASLLLQNATGNKYPLTHPFFKTHIKRRIAMITHTNTHRKSLLARLLIIPTITALICLFSFKSEKRFTPAAARTIRVVIDAGHSASFQGAYANGVREHDLDLNLAKKIQSLSKEYNVDVIMTRETDADAGGKTLSESLHYRATLAEKTSAELFISIHASMKGEEPGQKPGAGFVIYVPQTNNKFYTNSVKLGSIITNYIKTDYTIAPELVQNSTHIQVIDFNSVPAVLIECGFLDNQADVKFITDEKNQEKIARDILEGIRKYATQSASYLKSANDANYSITADTIIEETLKNIDVRQIAEMDVNRNTKLITITTKDGKKYVEIITPAMIQSWDSAHAAEINHPDTSNSHHEVFTQVEVEAQFPGGQQAWYQYLQKHLNYPDSAVAKEIQGQVVVKFIVKKSGTLTDIQVVSGPKELRESSVEIIKKSGKWIPAKQNGLVVESWHTQPINYVLEAQ